MAEEIPIPSPEDLKKLRKRLGLTQAEAAERIAVGQAVWAAWESGQRKPSRQSAKLIDLLRKKKI